LIFGLAQSVFIWLDIIKNEGKKMNRQFVTSILILVILCICSCGNPEKDFLEAKKSNTVESYQKFLIEYPESEFTGSAKKELAKLEYKIVSDTNSIKKHKDFLAKYPKSEFVDQVKEKLAKLELEHLFDQLNDQPQGRDQEKILGDLEHWDPKIRWDAAQEIGHRPFVEAIESLLDSLLDSNTLVRWEASLALKKFKTPEQRTHLEQFKSNILELKSVDANTDFANALKLGALKFVLNEDPNSELSSALSLRPDDLLANTLMVNWALKKNMMNENVISTSDLLLGFVGKDLKNEGFIAEGEIDESNYKKALIEGRAIYGSAKICKDLTVMILKYAFFYKVEGGRNIRVNHDAVEKANSAIKAYAMIATTIEKKVEPFYPQLKYSTNQEQEFHEAEARSAYKRKKAAIKLRNYRLDTVSIALDKAYTSENDKNVRKEIFKSLKVIAPKKALNILITELKKTKDADPADSTVKEIGSIGGQKACSSLIEKGDRLKGRHLFGIWMDPKYNTIVASLNDALSEVKDIKFKSIVKNKIDEYSTKSN
jgi:hypothetical protein